MRLACVLLVVLVSAAGCVTGPPHEAAPVRGIGDRDVMKLRFLAQRNINRNYDNVSADAYRIWEEVWERAKKLDPTGKGMIPADFAEAAIEKRNRHLQRIEAARQAEMDQARALHENYVSTSAALFETWEEQGKLTAEMVGQFRDFAVEMGQLYAEHRRQKSLAKEAKKAKEEAEAEEEEAPAGEGE